MAQGTKENPIVSNIYWNEKDSEGNLKHYVCYSGSMNTAPLRKQTFTVDEWVTEGEYQVFTIDSKLPVVSIYKTTSETTYSLVANVDVEILADGSQRLKALEAFDGYVLSFVG